MYQYIWGKIQDDNVLRKRYEDLCSEQVVAPKTILLRAGDVAQNFYYIKQGCARLSFNQDGKDITLQLFFEGQGVASIESFVENTPSLFSIETIEQTTVAVCKKVDLLLLIEDIAELKAELHNLIVSRMINYIHLFLSRIKDTPQQRYEELIRDHPEVVKRVPQHYIASYLGITPVSLSRIRSRR